MKRVYARNCTSKEINNLDADFFVEKNHAQGSVLGATTSIGLFNDNELVGVVQFGYPRTKAKQRRYSCELLRLAFKKDVQIIGGASKLIKFFIKTKKPSDFFTYQDTTGKASNVYAESGMTLVKEEKTKKYLVAPGKTLKTAKRKEYWSVGEVSRRGPDALLGTNLGEKFHENGRRKTNPELFVEELGWHFEETPGDRVYEWIDSRRSYYIYKITSQNSKKYYYGVRQIFNPAPTFDDCIKDDYFGSGGVKFSNWKQKYENTLNKEVLKIFKIKSVAYAAEEELVGDAWKSDPKCLNSMPGGAGKYSPPRRTEIKKCAIHGMVKHSGKICLTCIANKSIRLDACVIHGETKFQGVNCRKCVAAKNVSLKECFSHGLTKHVGEKCYLCMKNPIIVKDCAIHGATKFRGDQCYKCLADKKISIEKCDKHGVTKFRLGNCDKCNNDGYVTIMNCVIHGDTKHRLNKCSKCVAQKSVSMKECVLHGNTKHQGDVCNKCNAEAPLSTKNCKTHGDTIFIGDKCRKCISQYSFVIKECKRHGLVKFLGDKCCSCASEKSRSVKNCKIHGDTIFFGDKCGKCSSKKAFSQRECDTHGITTFRGLKCQKCISASKKEVKNCELHGEQSHYNNVCSKCRGERIKHVRNHQNVKDANCKYCT